MTDIFNTSKLRQLSLALLGATALTACGGGGGGGGGTPTPPGGGGGGSTNQPPVLNGASDFTFAENEQVIFTLDVSDPDSSTLTIELLAGGDGALFQVDTDGNISRLNGVGFDFENPEDGNSDNVYEQSIRISDGTNSITENITVTITNVDEAPVLTTPPQTFDENFTGDLVTLAFEDPEGEPVTGFTITQVSRFNEVVNSDRLLAAFSVDPDTAVLTINTPFDFESEEFKEFDVTVEATDGTTTGGGTIRLTLQDLPAVVASGIAYTGTDTDNLFGAFAAPVGDLDGDGLEEVWVASEVQTGLENIPETARLIWGSTIRDEMADGVGDLDVSALTADQAIIVTNEIFTTLGNKISTLIAEPIADIDGDGIPEVMIGFQEQRIERDTPDEVDGPTAMVLWGSTLANNTSGTLDLTALAANEGLTLSGLSRVEAVDLQLGSADVDGDGRGDVVLGRPNNQEVRVIFGSAINAAKAAGDLDLATAGTSTVLELTAEDTGAAIILPVGAALDGLSDIDGDGNDELVLVGSNRTADGDALYVVAGNLLATAKGGANASINILEAAQDTDIAEFGFGFITAIDLSADGDIDGDGLDDIAATFGVAGEPLPDAVVIYGATAQAALGTTNDATYPFAAGEATDIYLTQTRINPDEFGSTEIDRVRIVPSVGGGAGADLLLGVIDDDPLGRDSAGSVTIFTDTALTTALDDEVRASTDDFPASLGRIFFGISRESALGGNAFIADLDGDGLPDLSLATTGQVEFGDADTDDAYYFLPGTDIEAAFAAADGSYDMAESLAKEGN